jgi:hypothetical protein
MGSELSTFGKKNYGNGCALPSWVAAIRTKMSFIIPTLALSDPHLDLDIGLP